MNTSSGLSHDATISAAMGWRLNLVLRNPLLNRSLQSHFWNLASPKIPCHVSLNVPLLSLGRRLRPVWVNDLPIVLLLHPPPAVLRQALGQFLMRYHLHSQPMVVETIEQWVSPECNLCGW